jgi:hypothetical protein
MNSFGRLLGKNGPMETYMGLRSTVLHADISAIELVDGEWPGASVAMMEMPVGDAIASIVAVADGTVSLYTSSGGGVLGAGEYGAARAAGQRFLRAAADHAAWMTATTEFPLPAAGKVCFHVRTPDGDYTSEVAEDTLRARRDELAALYLAGQDVLSELRLISEANGAA